MPYTGCAFFGLYQELQRIHLNAVDQRVVLLINLGQAAVEILLEQVWHPLWLTVVFVMALQNVIPLGIDAVAHYVIDTLVQLPGVIDEINQRLASGERP
ncbi:hypothetical protein SPRA44_280084 [Serratia proteamaculans]|nr:hypothetical protein SPRA44_280084 [Serratia proteamaculans]